MGVSPTKAARMMAANGPAQYPKPAPMPAYLTADGELTEAGEHVVDLESKVYPHTGSKEQAVRDLLGITTTTYYQLLNKMIDDDRVLELEPLLVNRLRRIRESRRRTRPGKSI